MHHNADQRDHFQMLHQTTSARRPDDNWQLNEQNRQQTSPKVQKYLEGRYNTVQYIMYFIIFAIFRIHSTTLYNSNDFCGTPMTIPLIPFQLFNPIQTGLFLTLARPRSITQDWLMLQIWYMEVAFHINRSKNYK